MNKSICGADCTKCQFNKKCKGCVDTNGCPFGKQCFVAKYINIGGMEKYSEFKQTLIDEFNELQIPAMAKINELYPLLGGFVNLEYILPNGQPVRFLDDDSIYLGNQVECAFEENSGRYFGLVAGIDFLLVCEYGENGDNPEIITFKKRI